MTEESESLIGFELGKYARLGFDLGLSGSPQNNEFYEAVQEAVAREISEIEKGIKRCRCCGRFPNIRRFGDYWYADCETYSCSRKTYPIETTICAVIDAWNELQEQEEEK